MKLASDKTSLHNLASILLVSIIFFSCKKEGNNNSRNLLRSISYKGAFVNKIDTFIYDSRWRLIGFGEVNGGMTTLEYDGSSDLLTKGNYFVNGNKNYSFSFLYNSVNQITRKIMIPGTIGTLNDYGYEYDSEGKFIKEKTYYRQTDSVIFITINSYNNNNLSEQDITDLINTGNHGKFIFFYDNKLNPYYLLGNNYYYAGGRFSALSKNNQTQHNMWWGGYTKAQYTYLRNGYPAKATVEESISPSTKFTFSVVYNYW